MSIGVINANQVESSKWVVNVFKWSVANVLCVFFYKESIGRGPSVVRTLWGMPIGIDKDNQ